jgi:hypothetical protein
MKHDDRTPRTVPFDPDGAVTHFWYSRGRLACNVVTPRATVLLRLSLEEVRQAIRSLAKNEHHDLPMDGTKIWWDHDEVRTVELYRDDFFSVILPEAAGLALLAVVNERLPEFEARRAEQPA